MLGVYFKEEIEEIGGSQNGGVCGKSTWIPEKTRLASLSKKQKGFHHLAADCTACSGNDAGYGRNDGYGRGDVYVRPAVVYGRDGYQAPDALSPDRSFCSCLPSSGQRALFSPKVSRVAVGGWRLALAPRACVLVRLQLRPRQEIAEAGQRCDVLETRSNSPMVQYFANPLVDYRVWHLREPDHF